MIGSRIKEKYFGFIPLGNNCSNGKFFVKDCVITL